jgi:hypothetical protein
MTSLADVSSIGAPRKMIRSSNSFVYGESSLNPYDVRSVKVGRM